MITIYGSPKSSAGRCFWTLEEIGIDYQTQAMNFQKQEHKSEKYLQINPNGKIPALTDGDYKIWESMAINLYLAEKYKPELLGKTPEEKGHVYQWSVWSIAELQEPLINIFIQLVFVPEEKRDMKIIETSKEKLPNLLKVLEVSLTDSRFLASNEFSLADLNTASVVAICEYINYDISDYKNINKWLGAISERPAFQRFKDLCK